MTPDDTLAALRKATPHGNFDIGWNAALDAVERVRVAPSPDAPGTDVVERRRLAGRLAAWALSPGESFRTLLPYLDLDYETAYREGWMAFTNGILERMERAPVAPSPDALDVERLAEVIRTHSYHVRPGEDGMAAILCTCGVLLGGSFNGWLNGAPVPPTYAAHVARQYAAQSKEPTE